MDYDFYYSKKHAEHLDYLNTFQLERKKKTFVNGIQYTEMIESGLKPITKKNFSDDLRLVYSGSNYEITLEV